MKTSFKKKNLNDYRFYKFYRPSNLKSFSQCIKATVCNTIFEKKNDPLKVNKDNCSPRMKLTFNVFQETKFFETHMKYEDLQVNL